MLYQLTNGRELSSDFYIKYVTYLQASNRLRSLGTCSALGEVNALSIIPLPTVLAVYHLSHEFESVYRFLGQVAQAHHLIT